MVYKVNTVELKKLLIENGYDTIGDFAKDADMSRKTAADVVNGKRRPSTIIMEKFITVLHIEPQNAGIIFFIPTLRDT